MPTINGSLAATQRAVSPEEEIFDCETLRFHLSLLKSPSLTLDTEEASLAPIIKSCVLANSQVASQIPQFGLLAGESNALDSLELGQDPKFADLSDDPRILFNVTPPSSTFVCGSQGSGKSHTLSCLLENCLIPSRVGRLPNPLTGLVFHYDTFISDTSGSPCEAAFLSSHPGVKVKVLCSPTNVHTIRGTYSRFNVQVEALQIDQKDLNTKRMMDLMAVGQEGGRVPLYIHTIKRILRDMRILQQESGAGFDYYGFKRLVAGSGLTPTQLEPLNQRLGLLESFMPHAQTRKAKKSKKKGGSSWELMPSCLTIVDLSCPCISPETACSLFNICLAIFLEQDTNVGRVVALDEAHKYMNASIESQMFTDTLLSAIRLQRHLGARIFICTQEPTISTALLNLCTVTIVHRFTSPEWLHALNKHLAVDSQTPSRNDATIDESTSLFNRIVRLRVGEALLFAPSAILGTTTQENGKVAFDLLGIGFLPVKIRDRLTLDGGKSVLAV
ncbi:conserved hypothetical protein [Uncinocarpus reesii 1704]|uniref:Zona occludens toxin N-terminal domain-containing protein n=1 Tax=Uncinocarpus reesii (strain UAMH 1704) TaxID=336963 RepID=C4JNT8_UNCRE|nr:uncharacterized protein UREG_04408 [Uncinocarpus reesii 1704]EEP79562.1 conserved hypothetical protein [Uncinocarpus reesii 1704]